MCSPMRTGCVAVATGAPPDVGSAPPNHCGPGTGHRNETTPNRRTWKGRGPRRGRADWLTWLTVGWQGVVDKVDGREDWAVTSLVEQERELIELLTRRVHSTFAA